jgi:hypothetical protein
MTQSIAALQGKKPQSLIEAEKRKALIKQGKDPSAPQPAEPEQLVEIDETIKVPPESQSNALEILSRKMDNFLETLRREQATVSKPDVGDADIIIKVENEHVEFQFNAYEYYVDELSIPILMDKDSFQAMPKTSQGFVLTVDGKQYPVIFIGKPYHFESIDMGFITFVRDKDREEIQ